MAAARFLGLGAAAQSPGKPGDQCSPYLYWWPASRGDVRSPTSDRVFNEDPSSARVFIEVCRPLLSTVAGDSPRAVGSLWVSIPPVLGSAPSTRRQRSLVGSPQTARVFIEVYPPLAMRSLGPLPPALGAAPTSSKALPPPAAPVPALGPRSVGFEPTAGELHGYRWSCAVGRPWVAYPPVLGSAPMTTTDVARLTARPRARGTNGSPGGSRVPCPRQSSVRGGGD